MEAVLGGVNELGHHMGKRPTQCFTIKMPFPLYLEFKKFTQEWKKGAPEEDKDRYTMTGLRQLRRSKGHHSRSQRAQPSGQRRLDLEPKRIDNIALEQRPFPNIAAYLLFALVPGLLHDVAFVLTGEGRRGR